GGLRQDEPFGRLGTTRPAARRPGGAGRGGQQPRARFAPRRRPAGGGGRRGGAGRGAPLLGPPTLPSFEGLVTALINELAAQPEEVLLVLDDYHLIEAEPVHASLGFLLEHLPACLRLGGPSRAAPPV